MTDTTVAIAAGRDLRLDLLRGLAMVFVVVNHVELRSYWHLVTAERVGLVSGAEIFVVLSGLLVGMVHRRRLERDGWATSARSLLRRSGKLYCTAVVVVLAVFALRYVPFLDASGLSTYTDPRSGQVFDLYDGARSPAAFLHGVAVLRYGPGQFNIIGLYVVLLAAAPAALWLLARGRWRLLLAGSAAGYALAHAGFDRLLGSQFEQSFALLAWQLLFFGAMAVGFHRNGIAAALPSRARTAAVAMCGVLAAALAVLAWNSPWADVPEPARLALVDPDRFWALYSGWFDRRMLGLGRLVNVVVLLIAALAVLAPRWPAVERTVGRMLIPLGQASLYVFVVHLFFVLLADQLNLAHGRGIRTGTVFHVASLGAIWLMVRTRLLFGYIPR